MQGIADVRDDSSDRTGRRLVVVLKRDAVARVVLNNLYKHTELQTNFSANMLALVDDVPRTLTVDPFISHWVTHQIEVIQRRTRYRLRKAEEQAHIFRGMVKALDALDDVIALIRRTPDVDEARDGLIELLEIDEVQARRDPRHAAAPAGGAGAAEDHRRAGRARDRSSPTCEDILANEARQRQIVVDELAEIVDKFGDDRRSQIIPADGDLSMEDLIPDEDVVVTITRGGYAKRTRTDAYRLQKRGGKGVRGATLRGDDVVEHLFATTNHHWILFFTDQGRVYRTKAYHLPEAARDAKGGHVAGLLASSPTSRSPRCWRSATTSRRRTSCSPPATGMVKKTRLAEYDSPRQAGLIALNFRADDDELIGADLVDADDEVLLVSRKGQAVRFVADDGELRPMGRATSGVNGMRFRGGDEVLAMSVIRAGEDAGDAQYVFTMTDGGFAKRTADQRLPAAATAAAIGHQGDEAGQRRARRPGRRVHRRRRRRDPLDHPGRSGRPQPDQRRLPPDGTLDAGGEVRDAQGGRRRRRGHALGRGARGWSRTVVRGRASRTDHGRLADGRRG